MFWKMSHGPFTPRCSSFLETFRKISSYEPSTLDIRALWRRFGKYIRKVIFKEQSQFKTKDNSYDSAKISIEVVLKYENPFFTT